MTEPKKLFIKTYGCQMNVYDSERMVEAMGAEGYVTTDVAEEADMVLLNTCHIREKASEKLYSDLGRLRPLKDAPLRFFMRMSSMKKWPSLVMPFAMASRARWLYRFLTERVKACCSRVAGPI